MLKLNRPELFRQQCYVNGQWSDADEGESLDVTNPATGKVLGTIPKMGVSETRRAIQAASEAWGAWRNLTAKERAVILRRWFELMIANTEDLAQIMTAEQGKSLSESRGEIAYAASYLEWYSEEGKRAYGDVVPSSSRDKRIVVTKEPIGVRSHYALELSVFHDHSQGGGSACCRVSNRGQAGNADAILCIGACRPGRRGWGPTWHFFSRHRIGQRHRRRDDE